MKWLEYFQESLPGQMVLLNNGERVEILSVDDFDPDDRKVGIMNAQMNVTLRCPETGDTTAAVIYDDGSVHWIDDEGDVTDAPCGSFATDFGETHEDYYGECEA